MFLTGDPGWEIRTTGVFPTETNEHFCTSGTNQNRMDSSPFLLRKKMNIRTYHRPKYIFYIISIDFETSRTGLIKISKDGHASGLE
jgi:hypothetical protein